MTLARAGQKMNNHSPECAYWRRWITSLGALHPSCLPRCPADRLAAAKPPSRHRSAENQECGQ